MQESNPIRTDEFGLLATPLDSPQMLREAAPDLVPEFLRVGEEIGNMRNLTPDLQKEVAKRIKKELQGLMKELKTRAEAIRAQERHPDDLVQAIDVLESVWGRLSKWSGYED